MKAFTDCLSANTDSARLLRSLVTGNSDAILAARLAFELGRQWACEQMQASIDKAIAAQSSNRLEGSNA